MGWNIAKRYLDLCGSGVQTTKWCPVIHQKTSTKYVTTTVNSSCHNGHLEKCSQTDSPFGDNLTCNREDNSSTSCTEDWGCTIPPLFENLQKLPTRTLPATLYFVLMKAKRSSLALTCRKTSTPRTSAMISSVSWSISGWTRATWSLQAMQFPKAYVKYC